jgi:two-component system KDP operon response regulator KdpE
MTRTPGAALVLVVDDDPSIRRALRAELAAAGYETVEAADGEEGTRLFSEVEPDLVLTDLAMPGADGFDVVAAIRKTHRTPVIVLSVRGADTDKIRALDLGADDYVVKPFSVQELLARVRAQLRRHGDDAAQVLEFPGLTIDRERRRVVEGGREIRLTPTEFAILELLASLATVRVHVGSLRKKIEPDPARPRYVLTEPWVGYRFVAEPLDR